MKTLRIGLVAAVLAALSAASPVLAENASSNLVGTVTPNVVLRDLSGNYVFLNNIKNPVVLDFMGVDCAPCKKEMPAFLKVMREFKAQGVTAYLVCTDPLSKRDELDKLVTEFGVDCGVLLDPYKVACKKFGVETLPRTFVVSKDHKIVADISGATDKIEALLRAAIKKVLPAK